MKLTPEEAMRVVEHGKPYVSNRRHYIRYGGVSYPAASLVWCVHTGEWPTSTPRHLDNDPANNDFANLRPPGRTPRVSARKTARETMTAAQTVAQIEPVAETVNGVPDVLVYDPAAAQALSDLFNHPIAT